MKRNTLYQYPDRVKQLFLVSFSFIGTTHVSSAFFYLEISTIYYILRYINNKIKNSER